MEQYFDYHTHTVFSHGKGTIYENAEAAKQKGLLGIAITDHGFNHPFYGVKRNNLKKMRTLCIAAEHTTDISVRLGIEANILGDSGKCDVKPSDYDNLDVFGAGIHRCVLYDKPHDYLRLFGETFFNKTTKISPTDTLVKYTTDSYVNAIKKNPIDFITHINYLCFCDVLTVAKCCSDYGTLIEINTKKSHLSLQQWEQILSTDVKFIVNSDAHTPQRVGDTALFYEIDEKISFPRERIVNFQPQMPKLRFELFKERL